MSPTNLQRQQLSEALLSAFPTYGALERMVRFTLGTSLATIASGDNLSIAVYELIRWMEAHGRTRELIEGALQANPNNTLLRAIAEQLVQAEPPTDGQAGSGPDEALLYNARGKLLELSTQLIRADWQELKSDRGMLAQITEDLREAIAHLEKLRDRPLGERISLTRALEETYTALSALTLAADLARMESPRRATSFYDSIRLSRDALKHAVRALSGERAD